MKTIVLLILLTFAVALYFGYGPYDLVTLFQPKPAGVLSVKRAPDPQPQTRTMSAGSTVIVPAPDGSLDSRWTPYPSASPIQAAKP